MYFFLNHFVLKIIAEVLHQIHEIQKAEKKDG